MSEKKTMRRDLGLGTIILLVIANTFSGSIFVLLSEGAGATGTLLPLSYLFGAFLAFLIGAVYAEVASSIPEAGANLAYAFSAYGRGPISFILSWLSILGHIAYGAVNAFGFGLYLAVFLHVPAMWVAVAIVIVFSLFNLRGVKEMGSVGKWSVIVSLCLALVFVVLVCLHINFSFEQSLALFQNSSHSYFSIFAGTALIFSAFIGFEGVSSLAREIKTPHKNIPRAIFTVVGITTVMYVGIAYLTVYAVPIKELAASSAPLSLLAQSHGGRVASIAIFIAALLATATALLIDILISSRKVYAATEAGYLPKTLKKINKSGTPYLSVIVVGIGMVVLIFSNSVSFIAYLGNTTYLLFAALLSFGVILMRKKRPYLHRPFRLPLFPLIPILTIILAFVVIFASGATALFFLFVWLLAGFLFYLSSLISRDRLRWFFLGIGGMLFLVCLTAVLLRFFL